MRPKRRTRVGQILTPRGGCGDRGKGGDREGRKGFLSIYPSPYWPRKRKETLQACSRANN